MVPALLSADNGYDKQEVIMASEQSDHLAEVLGAVQDRLRNPDLGLPTVRDICETLGALAKV